VKQIKINKKIGGGRQYLNEADACGDGLKFSVFTAVLHPKLLVVV
jgi:hypothetical protein